MFIDIILQIIRVTYIIHDICYPNYKKGVSLKMAKMRYDPQKVASEKRGTYTVYMLDSRSSTHFVEQQHAAAFCCL